MRRYVGLFLISFAALALEVTLTRLLSVVTWYYLSFFAIATGLLGSTAGATSVYLQPDRFTRDKLERNIANACLGFALSTPVTLLILTRLKFAPVITVQSAMILLLATLACALPFYFGGMAVTAVLTRVQLPIGKLYASDLAGAALGSLFVLGGLEVMDAPSLIILIGAVAAGAGAVLMPGDSRANLRRWGWLAPVVFIMLAIVNSVSGVGIRPEYYKGSAVGRQNIWFEKWNSYSHVMLWNPEEAQARLWGPSPVAPQVIALQFNMQIDGDAATTIRQFSSLADIEPLRYDVTAIVHAVRPSGSVLVIGLGGGKDVQTALLFDHQKIVGVDVNPTFVNLLQGEFADFSGLGHRPGVMLYTAEGRAFASQSTDKYSIIQMSLTDTWAATGAGAFSLSENGLYTVEAWNVFYNDLSSDGVFTVSRWYNPDNLGETGRILSLAVATLLRNNADPSSHIALIVSDNISTLLVSRQPFSVSDTRTLRNAVQQLQFKAAILPDAPPDDPILRRIVAAKSLADLNTAAADQPLNFSPPTDERPYFFSMMKLDHIGFALAQTRGIVRGNMVATATLLLLILTLGIVAILTIVVPLRFRTAGSISTPRVRPLWSAALYFSLIGAGYMLVEIALMQRLSVFLSHPIYALGVLLFTMIASTGVGSYLSERLPLTRAPWLFIYPVVTACAILALRFASAAILANLITYPAPVKIAVSVLTIFPMGALLGLFFPTGMRLVRDVRAGETPWYWALNGIFSVLCSAVAVMISIYQGISVNFIIAAVCYLMVLLSLWRLRALAHTTAQSQPPA